MREGESLRADEIQTRRVRHRHRFEIRARANLHAARQTSPPPSPAHPMMAIAATISGPTRPRRYVGTLTAHIADMWQRLCKNSLVNFLRKRRGEMTLPAYARKLGISSSSLHRMEMGEQNVTLTTLKRLLKRLKCSASDVFNLK